MKKPQKFNFLEFNNNVLISSIKKINLSIILIVILDALFYFLSGYLVIFWLKRIQEKNAAFNLPADIVSLGYEKASQLVADVSNFYYLIILSFILLLIVIIFLASISKGIIWAKTTKTKISLALISKFLALNLIWMSFWFLLIFLISILMQPQSVLLFIVAAIILGLYFTNTLYVIFIKKQTFKNIFTAIKLNFTKIHMFLLPYALIFAILFIISFISELTKLDNLSFLITVKILGGSLGLEYSYIISDKLIGPLFAIISVLTNPLFLLSIAVVRYYTSTLVIETQRL